MPDSNERNGLEIAIIGMSGRFPGANKIREFWENLKNGVNSIRFFTEEELLEKSSVDPELIRNPNYVRAKGIIEDVEYFDAFFFGYSPMEAELLDPQIRIFYEVCWEALEDAACDPSTYPGSIGVYAGGSSNRSWEVLTIISGKQDIFGQFTTDTMCDKDYLSTRISHKLDLRGPSVSMHSACSTALVGLDLACRGLLTGQCDAALVGGVSALSETAKGGGYLYEEGLIRSPDGYVRAFDAKARGTVFSHGAGAVLLKRLDDAIADGDDIYAVIKGFAANNDGMLKSSFSAPAVDGQAQAIRAALYMAEVETESITYVEAHGTGTELGDPIEVEALRIAFDSDERHYCAIGSLKTNIGHLDVAAGVASVIKVALMMMHRQIPPSLNFETPNPKIDFENSPFFVNTQLREWKPNGYPLRAGVSSFGVGGTNVHVIMEEPPAVELSSQSRPYQLILLSARTAKALDQAAANFVNYLKANPEVNLADAAYTLAVGRKTFEHKKMLVCKDVEEALEILDTGTGGSEISDHSQRVQSHYEKEQKRTVFMFPGQGSQYVDMAKGLYESEPVFREELERCFEIFKQIMNYDLKEILYPSFKDNRSYRSYRTNIDQTEITQPVIFAVEYCLAKLLMAWGIEPYAMIGHSIGEYTAACLAGVFSLEDALTVVAWRGKLMQQMPGGSMLSVALPEKKLKPLLTEELALAAVNGPSQCVVSGTHEAIDAFARQLQEKDLQARKIHTSHAFHSRMMEPILITFEEKVGQATLNEPKIPCISNVTGQWITFQDALSPNYWARHLRGTVRFADGVMELLKEKDSIFIEVGPGRTLNTFVRQHPDKQPGHMTVNLVRHPKEEVSDAYYLLTGIGKVWLYGTPFDWNRFYSGQKRHRLRLPTYPFQPQPYWLRGNPMKLIKEGMPGKFLPGKKADIKDWFYIPSWKRAPIPYNGREEQEEQTFLLLENGSDFCIRLKEKLQQEGCEVIMVSAGAEFSNSGSGEFIVNPSQQGDYDTLFNVLRDMEPPLYRIVHAWMVTETYQNIEESRDKGFYSLLCLARAIRKQNFINDFKITVLTNNIQELNGDEILCPEKSTVLGPVKVIPQEFPNIRCRSIDIDVPEPGSCQEEKLTSHLLAEILVDSSDTIAAYRNNRRWVQIFEPVTPGKNGKFRSTLKKGGVYLITGGLGGIGLVLAEYLAGNLGAKLILTRRSDFPGRVEWDQWLNTHNKYDPISQKIRRLQEIEEMGGEVMVCRADVAHREQMEKVIARAEACFGQINGVIHAAGVMSGKSSVCSVDEISERECEEQFHPKIYGLLVLEELLKDKDIDFCLLMSSLSSVLGGLGFASYSAANIFMDAFVKKHNRMNYGEWVSVNWDAWELAKKEENGETTAITPEEGRQVFQHMWSLDGEEQVVVSTRNLPSMVERWITFGSLQADEPGVEKPTLQLARPDMANPYIAPRNQIEQKMVDIWQELLGIEQVGVGDDFFELGGDSLKAVAMISRIKKEFSVSMTIRELFNNPRVIDLVNCMEGPVDTGYTQLEPVEKREYYPVSAMQKRLYVLNEMEGISTAYNLPSIMPFEGKPEIQRLERTFRSLIQRHESMRTSFAMSENGPIQIVHNHFDFHVEYIEANANEKDEVIKKFIRPFDLGKPPLFRAGIIKLSENEHLLVVDIHHIVSDGVSYMTMLRDVNALYEDKAGSLPELRIQYKDFSQWQNSELGKTRLNQQKEYWLAQLKGDIPTLNIFTDYPRPSVQSFDGERINFQLDQAVTRELEQLIKKTGTTLYIVLLAALNVLVSRYSRQEDIIVGSPVAAREHVDLENLIGIFINAVLLRNYPMGSKIFKEFLDEVKNNTIAAFDNQGYPFGELIEELGIKLDITRNPLFDVELIVQNIDVADLEIDKGIFVSRRYDQKNAQLDISLEASEGDERIECAAVYCTKLFKRATMDRFIQHYINCIKAVVKNPAIPLANVDIMTEKEKRQLLVDFNDNTVEYPGDRLAHQLFEEQAAKAPDRIAVIGMDDRNIQYLTYKKLNEMSDGLARLLTGKGVKPAAIVALMPDRCPDMFIGVLGILKAGGAYLPIDPNYPEERIQYILADSGAGVLVSEGSKRSGWEGETVYLGDWLSEVSEVSGVSGVSGEIPTYLTHLTHPTHPCYVIYTSGSTGRPRGVVVRHDSFVNAAFGWEKEYHLDVMEVNLLQMASFSFDVFSGDIARALFTGGQLVICPEDTRVDLPALYSLVRNHRITLFEATPSLILPLMEYVYENQLDIPDLRLLILGSDVCPIEDFKRLTVRFMKRNRMRIVNSYGLTEATIDSSYYEGSPDDIPLKSSVPIGKPLPNVMFYILDPAGNLLPLGVPGELCIGGKGVAMGYLNNPELTNSRFQIPNSPLRFSASQLLSFSLYRTGDLARWLDDGNVEFLGRMDYQVKIRGFRVELGEIEARLTALEEIKEAVVLDKQDEKGNKYLCAYIVPAEERANGQFTVSELRAYLFGHLPDYMIPGRFIEINEIPLTPNGKIDTKALLALEGDIGIGTEYAAPTNEVEETLVKMWSEILLKSGVGIDDNFFDLGGQSLKAMQLMAMIKKAFDVKIPLIVFFQVGTIRGIAGLISRGRFPLLAEDSTNKTTEDHSFAGVKFEKKKRRKREV